MKYFGLLFFVSITIISCNKEEQTPSEFNLELPSYFPQTEYQFEANELTSDGFLLGKKLFFDPNLSKDGTISCASCHAPQNFFVDVNVPISFGVDGKQGTRNAPSLVNLLWNKSFMWDGGVNHIELSGLPALTDTNEMAETLANILDKLNNDSEYPYLFEQVFQEDEITDQQLFYAITQYTGSIISAGSKYDEVIKGENVFTTAENAGYEIFKANCASCHVEPLFTDYSYRNNGLASTSDEGRERISLDSDDFSKFKVPTLRNVMHTAPYMHDGRISTIDDVLTHYATGIVQSVTLDPILINGISLTEADKTNLIAFLNTLTDEELIRNSKFYE